MTASNNKLTTKSEQDLQYISFKYTETSDPALLLVYYHILSTELVVFASKLLTVFTIDTR